MLRFLFVVSTILTVTQCMCPDYPASVPDFDKRKFDGLWYEIARSPNTIEKEASCMTFSYGTTIRLEKTNFTGMYGIITGIGEGSRTAMATVSNFPDVDNPGYFVTISEHNENEWGSSVVAHGPTYAAVFSCHQLPGQAGTYETIATILGRTHTMTDETLAMLKKELQALGVDVDKMEMVDQSCQELP